VNFIDTNELPVVERKPGWHGRYFNSPSMTFGHYEFDAGATIERHEHPQEEVWHVVEGDLEITVGDVTRRAGPGCVAIVPPGTAHAVTALTDGKAIVVDYPIRAGFPAAEPRARSESVSAAGGSCGSPDRCTQPSA
jgi:quercetin dioxygenase-like cupin family protein